MMIRFVLFLVAVGTIVHVARWYAKEKRSKRIVRMTPDELVEAIIRRDISVLEVPPEKRASVNEILEEIQDEMDNF